ncbi:hypothetical protein AAFF_G00208720 [Aldrovandia affinis]|uniref:Uncharacterized protein n=1 Tax=Aldrovandia affinis TaxID=143900 RepID=A0AAD7RJS6_9TELE|nr:hypothetical protein AAFF_G00208720 [Aldrovandia affinis]
MCGRGQTPRQGWSQRREGQLDGTAIFSAALPRRWQAPGIRRDYSAHLQETLFIHNEEEQGSHSTAEQVLASSFLPCSIPKGRVEGGCSEKRAVLFSRSVSRIDYCELL